MTDDPMRCEKSPTGWHEFEIDTCCHCGYVAGQKPREDKR